MPKKRVKKSIRKKAVQKNKDIAIPIIALILNILILPGLGSIIGGKTHEGIWQITLAVIGFILSFVLIGIPLLIAVWIWGLVTGIKLIKEAQ